MQVFPRCSWASFPYLRIYTLHEYTLHNENKPKTKTLFHSEVQEYSLLEDGERLMDTVYGKEHVWAVVPDFPL